MRRILFINPFGIGDCLFTTPLISAIKKAWPDSFLGFWCNERVSEILKSNANIDVVFPLSRGDIKRIYGRSPLKVTRAAWGLYSKIRRANFDITLDFSLDHRYGFMSKLCAIKRRIGIDYKGRGRFLTQGLEITGYRDKHIVEYYLQLLPLIGINAKDPRLELYVEKKVSEWAKKFLAGENIPPDCILVGISPGAGESWGKDSIYKHWEPEKFAQAADEILKDFNSRILLFGNFADQAVCDEVYENIRDKSRVLKAYPQFSLSEFSALLANCRLLLTNDGGPLHMAVALGIKTVSIFGPVSEVVYGPYPQSEKNIVIKADFDCRPCYRNFRLPKCEYGRRCLSDIEPKTVSQAIRVLL